MKTLTSLIAVFVLLTAARAEASSIVVGNRARPTVEHLDSVKKAGFDYVELGLENTSKMSAEQFARLREHAKS